MSEQTTDEFMKDLTEDERQFLRLMRYALKAEREKTRSFWWAVYQKIKQGANQSFEQLDRLFSGKDEK